MLLIKPSHEERSAMADAWAVCVRFLGAVNRGCIESLPDAIAYMDSEAIEARLLSKARLWVVTGQGVLDRQATIEREEARINNGAARQKQAARS